MQQRQRPLAGTCHLPQCQSLQPCMHQGYGVNIAASDADFLSPPTLQPLEQAFHSRIVLIESSGMEEIQRDNNQFHQ